jgi:predicted RNase H-like HicB family nuclease
MNAADRGYALVIERGETGFGVYAPDLPGCVAAGKTREEALHLMEEAIRSHLDGLRTEGVQPPEPRHEVTYSRSPRR